MLAAASPLLGIYRAPFLLLPVTLVAAGAAASAYEGGFDAGATALALLGLVAAHASVNALNEASDFETGIDLATRRTPFSGGSGTLPRGALSARAARGLGLAAFAVAAAVGVVFVVRLGWVLVPLLGLGALAILLYTPWHTRSGLGEVFAGLGLGALPVLGTSLVQDGRVGPTTLLASLPAFLMTFDLLFLNEFPDEAADRAGGRRHLVIRLGRRGAARLYALAALLVPAVLAGGVLTLALPPLALVAALPSLLSVPGLRWALGSPESDVPVVALSLNVLWNLATNLLLAASLWLSIP